VIKAALLIYLTRCGNPEIKLGRISFQSGDTFSYTGATENLVTTGTYYFFNGKENVYAGRTPHYGGVYFVLRQFFNQENSYDLLIAIQVITEALATLFLFHFFFNITNSKMTSLLVLALCLGSSNWTCFSIYASPESFSISFLIFFLYYFRQYTITQLNRDLVFAGIFLSILTCLKSYYILMFLPVGIYFLGQQAETFVQRLSKIAIKSALVSAPLFILLTPWVIRNYQVYQKFIPLQISATAGYNYSDSELAFRKYVTSWGGEIIFWEKTSAGCYFMPRQDIPCEFKMPAYAFTEKNGIAEVENIRNKFVQLQGNYSDSLDHLVSKSFLELHKDYKSEKPFQYYVIAPARLAYTFLVNSGSYYLPIHSGNPCYSRVQLPVKLAESFCYWLGLIVGLPGIFILGFQKKNFILPFLPVMLIILFPIVLRANEARYFRTLEPILFLGIGYIAYLILERILKRTPTS
jgi:hypothetical protein